MCCAQSISKTLGTIESAAKAAPILTTQLPGYSGRSERAKLEGGSAYLMAISLTIAGVSSVPSKRQLLSGGCRNKLRSLMTGGQAALSANWFRA
jgi:hypothetical protein